MTHSPALSCSRRALVAAATGFALPGLGPRITRAAPPEWSSTVDLADPLLRESSGLVASLAMPGVFWVLNDSGNDPLLFATDAAGNALGRWRVTGATNRDWEDLALTTGPDGQFWLVIADTGNNLKTDVESGLNLAPEPRFDPDRPPGLAVTGETESALWTPVVFPDGPRDVEALLVHPVSGETVLIEKTIADRARFYGVPDPFTGAAVSLQPLGSIAQSGIAPLRMITGGAVAPAGDRFLLLTYDGTYEWTLQPGQTIAGALMDNAPTRLAEPGFGQWEGVTYDATGAVRWFVAEGNPSLLQSDRSS